MTDNFTQTNSKTPSFYLYIYKFSPVQTNEINDLLLIEALIQQLYIKHLFLSLLLSKGKYNPRESILSSQRLQIQYKISHFSFKNKSMATVTGITHLVEKWSGEVGR